jgi:hypothetical protein
MNRQGGLNPRLSEGSRMVGEGDGDSADASEREHHDSDPLLTRCHAHLWVALKGSQRGFDDEESEVEIEQLVPVAGGGVVPRDKPERGADRWPVRLWLSAPRVDVDRCLG